VVQYNTRGSVGGDNSSLVEILYSYVVAFMFTVANLGNCEIISFYDVHVHGCRNCTVYVVWRIYMVEVQFSTYMYL
jgi:hypothetical protein